MQSFRFHHNVASAIRRSDPVCFCSSSNAQFALPWGRDMRCALVSVRTCPKSFLKLLLLLYVLSNVGSNCTQPSRNKRQLKRTWLIPKTLVVGLLFVATAAWATEQLLHFCSSRRLKSSLHIANGHTMLNTPVLVRSPKLSNIGRG